MDAEGDVVKSKSTTIIEAPPSCIEFSPFYPAHVVVGTYSLASDDHGAQDDQHGQVAGNQAQSRSGSLILFKLGKTHMSLIQTISIPYAVLDLHFHPYEPDLLAVAASTGIISVFKLAILDPAPLRHLVNIELAEPSILVLSLAWCPREIDSSLLAASLSDGRIVTLDSQAPKNSTRLGASHSLEAWTVAWSVIDKKYPSPQLYSGGDDSAMCRQNLEMNQLNLTESNEHNESNVYRPLIRDIKIHGAGVTAILPLNGRDESAEGRPEWLLTGSYDEHVRVLRLETSQDRSKFQILVEKRLHGGVWRLKLMATIANHGNPIFVVLASCMHAGARILKVLQSKQGGWFIEIVARFEEHESMNYASDAQMNIHASTLDFTVVSTSFYDRKLCVWKYEET